MGAFPDARIDAGIDARLGGTVYLSAHTAFSTTGTNEVTGGSPAYARKLMAMDASTGRTADNTDAETLDIPASTTVRWLGMFDAASAGNFLGMVPNGSTKSLVGVVVPSAEAGLAADTIVTCSTAAGHGFVQDDTVVLLSIDGSMPQGATEGTVYWVIGSPTANTLQISDTQDGQPLNFTEQGPFIISDIVEEVFGSQGTLSLGAGDLDIVGIA